MRLLLRLVLCLLFVGAGRSHFQDPDAWAAIVPPPLPARACVYLSGMAEIVLGLGLLIFPEQAAWGLIVLLLAIFPANIYMAVSGVQLHGFPSQPWMAWARLPFQFVLIALVWWSRPPKP